MFGTFAKMRARPEVSAEVARGGVEYEDSHPTTVLDARPKASTENKSQKRELKPAHFIRAASSRGMLIVGQDHHVDWFDTRRGLLAVNE